MNNKKKDESMFYYYIIIIILISGLTEMQTGGKRSFEYIINDSRTLQLIIAQQSNTPQSLPQNNLISNI